MTPDELKTARTTLGLTQAQFAQVLGLDGVHSARTVRRWEDAERDIPGPVVVLTGLLLRLPAVRKALGV